MVVDWKGRSRAVAVGRLKVETRPMIMVEFQGDYVLEFKHNFFFFNSCALTTVDQGALENRRSLVMIKWR